MFQVSQFRQSVLLRSLILIPPQHTLYLSLRAHVSDRVFFLFCFVYVCFCVTVYFVEGSISPEYFLSTCHTPGWERQRAFITLTTSRLERTMYCHSTIGKIPCDTPLRSVATEKKKEIKYFLVIRNNHRNVPDSWCSESHDKKGSIDLPFRSSGMRVSFTKPLQL